MNYQNVAAFTNRPNTYVYTANPFSGTLPPHLTNAAVQTAGVKTTTFQGSGQGTVSPQTMELIHSVYSELDKYGPEHKQRTMEAIHDMGKRIFLSGPPTPDVIRKCGPFVLELAAWVRAKASESNPEFMETAMDWVCSAAKECHTKDEFQEVFNCAQALSTHVKEKDEDEVDELFFFNRAMSEIITAQPGDKAQYWWHEALYISDRTIYAYVTEKAMEGQAASKKPDASPDDQFVLYRLECGLISIAARSDRVRDVAYAMIRTCRHQGHERFQNSSGFKRDLARVYGRAVPPGGCVLV